MPINIFTTIDDPLADLADNRGTVANGINTAGQIVGLYTHFGDHGFLLSGGAFTTLDDPLNVGTNTVALGINASGQVVGWYLAGGAHGFLYNPNSGTYTTIDDP